MPDRLKKNILYHLLSLSAIIITLIFSSCNSNHNGKIRIPRLTPKYSYRDKEPMGSFIAYHYVCNLFENGIAGIKTKSFSNQWYENDQEKSVYLLIAKNVFLSKLDISYLLNYVSNGNTVFVSSEYIDQELLDTLGINMYVDYTTFMGISEYRLEKKDTWVSLADKQISSGKKYGLFWLPFENYFYDYDPSGIQVIGVNENRKANMIVLNHGNGKFIFHAAPAVFSNYFLLKPGNTEYLENIFSYFNPAAKSVYWDNYYRLHTGTEEFSITGFFKKSPALYPAFLLTLSLLLLFIAFGGKRKQRFVPEKNLPVNSTVNYTETIGRLYLQKKDNKNISQKMITYFLEFVRNNYFLNTNQLNNDFVSALSRKSGVTELKVNNLLQLIQEISEAENVSDLKLLELHNGLQIVIKK